MNTEMWIKAWKSQGQELAEDSVFRNLLYRRRHHSFTNMTIWKMYGTFDCAKCPRRWTSTECVTEWRYKFKLLEYYGQIELVKEFRQQCQKCDTFCSPLFDQEAIDLAMQKIISRIKNVFYGKTTGNPHGGASERHSSAKDRKAPHDWERCEACRENCCYLTKPMSDFVAKDSQGKEENKPKKKKGQKRVDKGKKDWIGWNLKVQDGKELFICVEDWYFDPTEGENEDDDRAEDREDLSEEAVTDQEKKITIELKPCKTVQQQVNQYSQPDPDDWMTKTPQENQSRRTPRLEQEAQFSFGNSKRLMEAENRARHERRTVARNRKEQSMCCAIL